MSTKKIVSNLAEYKNGQLTCILCKVPVKNELYWTGHVNGRVHRNNIQSLKRKAQPEKSSDTPTEVKKIRVDDGVKGAAKPPPVPQDIEERIIFKPKVSPAQIAAKSPVENHPGLTTTAVMSEDGGDGRTEAGDIRNNVNDKKAGSKADLPEGFFDDPKLDAKVRGVEFVNPEEAEWQKFMKEIASEEIQSDNIQVYDEEESRKERELDEIEDMMMHWQK